MHDENLHLISTAGEFASLRDRIRQLGLWQALSGNAITRLKPHDLQLAEQNYLVAFSTGARRSS